MVPTAGSTKVLGFKCQGLWTYSAGLFIKPVGDVGASCKDNGVAFTFAVIFVQKFSQVEHLVEERHPAVIVRVVLADILGRVVVAQLVGRGIVFSLRVGQLLCFLGARRRNSCSHFK